MTLIKKLFILPSKRGDRLFVLIFMFIGLIWGIASVALRGMHFETNFIDTPLWMLITLPFSTNIILVTILGTPLLWLGKPGEVIGLILFALLFLNPFLVPFLALVFGISYGILFAKAILFVRDKLRNKNKQIA